MEKLQFPSEGWAVFNGHVADAGRRAMAVCRARFPGAPEGSGMAELEAADREGIMAIFADAPTPASQLYASTCFVFANRLDATQESSAGERP